MPKTGGISSSQHRSVDSADVLPDPRSGTPSPAGSSRRGKGTSSSAGGSQVLSTLRGMMPGWSKRGGSGSKAKGKSPEAGGSGHGAGTETSGSASSSRRGDSSSEVFHDASPRLDSPRPSPRNSPPPSPRRGGPSSEVFHDARPRLDSPRPSPRNSPPPSPRREAAAGSGRAAVNGDEGRPEPDAVVPPAPRRTVADVASGMRHPHPKKESTQTSSWFSRTRVTPGKGMQLPVSGPALAKAPAPQRGAPEPPGVATAFAKGLFNGEDKKVRKTMRNAVTQIAPELPKPSMKDKPAEPMAALSDRGAMEAHIGQLFPIGGAGTLNGLLNPGGVQAKLSAALEHGAAAAPTSFPYTNHVLVSEDLAAACGRDAVRAQEALEVLSSGPAMEELLHGLSAGGLSGAPLDALRTATRLASTAAGFDALMTLMRPAPAADRRPGLRRLLTAAGKVASEGEAAGIANPLANGGHNAALKVAASGGRPTLADKVLAIELRVHNAAAPAAGVSPYAGLSPAEKTSVFTWKQGFRESGPGTELSKAQGRLAKMGKYVARAAKHERNSTVSFDRAHPLKNGAFIKARARMTAASINQVFGRKKSPLSPLRSMGVNNAGQSQPDVNITMLDECVGAAMGELGAQLARQLPAAGTPEHNATRDGLADRATALPAGIERAALMKYLQDPAREERPLGQKFDAHALMQVATDIATTHRVPGAAGAIARKLEPWSGRSVTLPHLRQWGRESGLAETAPTAHAGGGEAVPGEPPTLRQETAFGKALRQAANIVDPASNRPADMTPDGAHRYVRTFIQETPWGNLATAGSGGAVGVNLAPVAIGVNKVAGKLTGLIGSSAVDGAAGPIADVRGVRSHSAQISFGTSHHGGELFIGTQKQNAGALGGGFGASIRAGFGKVFSGGGGAAATVTPLAGEKDYTRGVMVRTSRPETADGTGFNTALARGEMVRFVDFLFGMAKAEDGERQAPAQSWEKIANEFFDSDTLSIGWHHQSAETLRHTASAQVIGRVGVVAHEKPFESVGIGGTATIGADWASAANNKRTEGTGAFRMVRNNHQSRFQVTAQLGGGGTNPAIPIDSGAPTLGALHVVPPDDRVQTIPVVLEPGAPTAESLNGGLPLYGARANLSLVDQGLIVTLRAIIEDGRLSETYTLREVEHRDPRQFKAMLTEPSRRAQYEKVFEAVHGAAEGGNELRKFIDRLDNWAGPGQRYGMRSRIRADVRRGLDESAALATTIHRRDPADPRLAQISAHMMAQLNDERSWVPMLIQAYEAQSASDVAGLNFGLVATSNFTVTSDRELYATGVAPNVVRAWADLPAPAAPARPEGA